MESIRQRPTEAERFWSKVAKSDGCWLWTAGKYWDGYGAFMVRIDGRKRMWRAHRWVYEHAIGPIPDGYQVCHRCDVPGCVNPAHLFVGTTADNVRDMDAKGRRVRRGAVGEANRTARLTESDVRAIRAEFDRGVPRGWKRRTATRYGIQEAAIGKITRRENWKHVA